MNIKTDQLCCYIEGVRIPVKSIKTESGRNKLLIADIEIALGDGIISKIWANAFVQVTYILNREEKLLFQGLCKMLDILEAKGTMILRAESTFTTLNSNSTLDYTAPKRMGIFNLSGDDSKVFIGNESEISIIPPSNENDYTLAARYFFLPEEVRNFPVEQLDDSDKSKLEFVANKLPFAERFASTFFEDIGYQNFLLTQCAVDRFNLLAKSKTRQQIDKEESELSIRLSPGNIPLDPDRTGIKYKWARFKKTSSNPFDGERVKSSYPYQPISQRAKDDILNHKGGWENAGVTLTDILSDYDNFCKQLDVDPNMLIAQAKQENGFKAKGESYAAAVGWAQFIASTWVAYAPSGKTDPSFRTDVRASIYAQCKYMGALLKQEDGNMEHALKDYNGGDWRRHDNEPPTSQNKSYWTNILAIYNDYIK